MISTLIAMDRATFNTIQLLLEIIFVFWFFKILYPKIRLPQKPTRKDRGHDPDSRG